MKPKMLNFRTYEVLSSERYSIPYGGSFLADNNNSQEIDVLNDFIMHLDLNIKLMTSVRLKQLKKFLNQK